VSSLARAKSNASHNIRVYSWLERKDRFGEAAETNTRAACAPQGRVIRAIRGLSPIRFNDSTIQRFNDLTAAKQFVFIHVHSWLRSADGCG